MFSVFRSLFGAAPGPFQVEKDNGFQDVTPEEDKLLRSAFSKGSNLVTYRARGQYYEANFAKMEQRNIRTGRVRKLRPPAKWLEDDSGVDDNDRSVKSGHSASSNSSKLSGRTARSAASTPRQQQMSNAMDSPRAPLTPSPRGLLRLVSASSEGSRGADSPRAPCTPSPRGVRKVPLKTPKARASTPPPYPYGASGAAILAGSEICTAVAAALVDTDLRSAPTPPQRVYDV